ncbi:MAG TPA: hypothetical protein VGV16_00310 [Gammaproteobacteria bacterium]|nr:hypothetical protein [Gammaproteobacteria bacterium]
MIIIWNTPTLMERLHRRTLSDAHAFVYFFLTLMYDYVGFTLAYLGQDGQPLTPWGKTVVFTALALTCFGVLSMFFCNGGKEGVQFFHRYFSLSVVIGIKVGIALYLIGFIPGILHLLIGSSFQYPAWFNYSYYLALNILLFVLIGRRLYALRKTA